MNNPQNLLDILFIYFFKVAWAVSSSHHLTWIRLLYLYFKNNSDVGEKIWGILITDSQTISRVGFRWSKNPIPRADWLMVIFFIFYNTRKKGWKDKICFSWNGFLSSINNIFGWEEHVWFWCGIIHKSMLNWMWKHFVLSHFSLSFMRKKI